MLIADYLVSLSFDVMLIYPRPSLGQISPDNLTCFFKC